MNKTCGECKYFSCSGEGRCMDDEWTFCDSDACEKFKPKVATNGDVIRQMSNEKLAELFDNSCKVCAKDIVGCDTDCVAGILAWLNAPAESEGKNV